MTPEHTSPSPPPVPQDATQLHASLSSNQEEMYEKVLVHFTEEGFTLSGAPEGKGQLMEEEKFWLVSLLRPPLP